MTRLRHQVGLLHAPRGGHDEVERQVLAGPLDGRAQQRQVQHRREFAAQVVDRRGRAGQAGVGEVEMVALVHGQRFAGFQAGPHGRGAGVVLAPLRAQVQARTAQVAGIGLVPHEVHGHAMPVRQQQHVVQTFELVVQPLKGLTGDVDQRFGFLAVRAQRAGGDDMGFAGTGRIEPVRIDAAAPAAQHRAVALLPTVGVTQAEGFDFLDVRGVGLQGHGRASMRSVNVPPTILCPVPARANGGLPTAAAALQQARCNRCRRAAPAVACGGGERRGPGPRVCARGLHASH